MRSYYTLTTNLRFEQQVTDAGQTNDSKTLLKGDLRTCSDMLHKLNVLQLMKCNVVTYIRLLEKHIYDRTIKNLS